MLDLPKKPPEKYRVLKIQLSDIVNNTNIIEKMFNATDRTNKLVIHTYQFLWLWILNKYHEKNDIPEITTDIIQMAFKTLTLKSIAGPNLKGKNKEDYDEFNKFYEEKYKDLGYENKLDGINLSQIIAYTSVSMLTCIENNIKMNFLNYIRKFVNCSYADHNKEILEKLKGIEKKEMNKILKKELCTVKEDLINNTLLSNEKYHKWIKEHRPFIAPKDTSKLTQLDINGNPQQFLKNMIYINIELEKLKKKLGQVFPLRKSIIPHHIPIDTKSVVELFFEKDKGDYLKNITKYEKEVWEKIFKMNHKIFKLKNYTFNNYITTDCYTVSIHFIHNTYYEPDKEKKENRINALKKDKENTKDMTPVEKVIYKQQKKDNKKKIEKENRIKIKEQNAKLSKDEKKALNEKKNKNKHIEFPYIEDLTEEQINHLMFNCVYCDPGKNNLFTFIDDNDNVLTYTMRQRLHETKRLKYQRLLQNHRNKVGISMFESLLSEFNSRSCILETFSKYVNKKNDINKDLFDDYSNLKFRQYKWYTYINTKRSNAKLLNTIEEKYAIKETDGSYRKLNIIIGDWSVSKQMQNFMPTPNITLKRLLKERFNVYNIYEYNTSALSYVTEEKCDNMYVTDKKNVSRKLHSVRIYSMINNRRGCINRDINAVKNMRKLSDYWLANNGRPVSYIPRAANPSIEASSGSKPEKGTITCLRKHQPLSQQITQKISRKKKSTKIILTKNISNLNADLKA